MPSFDGAGPAVTATRSGPDPTGQPGRRNRRRNLLILLLGVGLAAVPLTSVVDAGMRAVDSSEGLSSLVAPDAAEARVGERLFFESRFAQFFFVHSGSDVNGSLSEGDALMSETQVADGQPLPGPFRGQAMNCRQCHLGDDYLPGRPFAGRTYVDFSRRSRLPARPDGLGRTARNSPSMVDLGLSREVPTLFHFDGEFADLEELVIDTLTGRNLGWLPAERSVARAHAAQVIRGDNGFSPRRVKYRDGSGIPYRVVLEGRDSDIPESLRIPARYRVDVASATDLEILAAVARLIHAYVDSLRFGNRGTLRESQSPYDLFLSKNGLPEKHRQGESGRGYAKRLLGLINERKAYVWVSPPKDGRFDLHRQRFEFGSLELQGLKIFFASPSNPAAPHVGNCVSCHTPPRFTDYSLHNDGASQDEYDSVFGTGAFSRITIPDLATRNGHFDEYLPPSDQHPKATGRFRAAPDASRPGFADLGSWNVFANPDMPDPQAALRTIFCSSAGSGRSDCEAQGVLPRTVGFFKTASMRDLGQSDPYFHSGAVDSLEDAIGLYVRTSALARGGKLRNGSPEMAVIRIETSDVVPLSAFLRSLNEDYR